MLQEIERAISRLSRAERGVAEWVLEHPRQATELPVAALARAAGTSEPTVVRFCRSVGLSGVRELKLRLAESLSRPGSYVHRDVGPDDSTADAVTKVLDRSIQALLELRARSGSLPFDAAVRAMGSARQILFAGLGASAAVARDARQKFFRLGIPTTALTDAPTLLQSAAIARPDDLFFLISHTGRWADFARAASIAAGRGSSVIAMTRPGSPLAETAGILFGLRVAEDTSVYTPMSSRLAQLAVLDSLQVALAVSLGETAETMLRETKQALLTN
jgi:RpiR family transcriptional regulator, carbohydrate utilization regulator